MNQVCIHPDQRRVHMATEALSLLVTVPFFFWLATELEQPALKTLATGLGVGALVVDGWLLYRFATRTQDRPVRYAA